MTDLNSKKLVMPLGKYKGMYVTDIVKLTQVDKNGEDKPVGFNYLKWLVQQDWYHHKETIQKIIDDVSNTISDVDTETKEIVEEIKKPKIKKSEAKPTEKKSKKTKEGTVNISTENNVLEFQ